jgi:hypothetical protein
MRIYVAGPYGSHDLPAEKRLANTMVAIRAGRELIKKGHEPYIPHLSHFVHEGWPDSPEADTWKRLDLVWLPFCEAILMVGNWQTSSGAIDELNASMRLGHFIFYSLAEVPDVT